MDLLEYDGSILGLQTPRYRHLPTSGRSVPHAGREVIELASMAGLQLDPWQQQVIKDACTRSDVAFWNPYTNRWEYKWAAYEVGVMVSRQNGKGSILEARELAGLFVFRERLIIHSAHQFDTSREAFERLLSLIQNTPELDAKVMRAPRGHGEEGIELKPEKHEKVTGRAPRINFRTRTAGGGRGFTGDLLVLDESMYLDSGMVRALMPTLVARPNSQIWYTGSAGDKRSTQFGRVRSRGINSGPDEEPRLFYVEWSADLCRKDCPTGCDEHDDPDDVHTWAKANPGLGIRVEADAIAADHDSMDSVDFAWEHLGVGDWPVDGTGWLLIGKNSWMRQHDEYSFPLPPFAIALDVSPDRSMSGIAVCGANEDGNFHVEITGNQQWAIENGYDTAFYDYRPGTGWVFDRVMNIWRNQKPACLVIDKANQAGSFVDQFEKAGVKVVSPTSREYAQACGEFLTGIVPPKGDPANTVHLNQKPLNDAVRVAEERVIQDLWAWSKGKSYGDITPLVAATLARWGYKTHVYRQKAATPWVYRR